MLPAAWEVDAPLRHPFAELDEIDDFPASVHVLHALHQRHAV